MIVTKEEQKKVFIPFDLTIHFDSRKEAEEMYALFNISMIASALDHVNAEAIRITLGRDQFGVDTVHCALQKRLKEGFAKI